MKTWLKFGLISMSLLLTHCVTPIKGNDFTQAIHGRTFTPQGEYVIGPNDKLSIQILGGNDVTGDFIVTQQGTISLPLIGAEKAAGLTEKQLISVLTQRFTKFFKVPTVSVGVVGYESYKVFITGDVRRPGVFVFQEKTSLLQGIATAGGLGDFAKGQIILHRVGKKGVVEKYVTTYQKVLNGDKQLDGFILERGDVVHVF
ncbi:MAG: polysaccharide biosynthesis/export family protein [Chitinophagaceae bacterium]|nr:polysaccharide biosynthesis/export family protein [Oligoflexus sp.]